ncbi:hypothetical protein [Nocardioides sp.]|uniref:hypothetical protein n=1 Tax=Nocardioides sp. TaxID=35761 RepID=UPI0026381973|nr:hypothetical protein [Nocardioides sp.]
MPRHRAATHARATTGARRPALLLAGLALVALATGCMAPGSAQAQRFDSLDLRLTLADSHVAGGRSVHSTWAIANRSKDPVVDPGCQVAAYRYAIVPVDEANNETDLWGAYIIDCSGPRTMEPGYDETYPGPDFPARTANGTALPPGNYVAMVEIPGRTGRLTQPITVT